jgi:hypothetical protein
VGADMTRTVDEEKCKPGWECGEYIIGVGDWDYTSTDHGAELL